MKRIIFISTLLMFCLSSGVLKAVAQNYSDENDGIALPFVTTKLINGSFDKSCHWYAIRINGNKYWKAGAEEVYCVNQYDENDPSYLFCFEGDNKKGFHIYNKELGPDVILCVKSSTSHEPLLPTLKDEASQPSTLKLSINQDGYNFYYPGNTTACVNDLHNDDILTLWTNSGAPTSTGCRTFFISVSTGGGGNGGNGNDNTQSSTELKPFSGKAHYVYLKSGGVDAYPVECLSSTSNEGGNITFVDKAENVYTYKANEVERISEEAPAELPQFESFKFNNKFNDMLIIDSEGVINEDGTITLSAGGIGKRLVPSFKLTSDDALVYVADELQKSKETSRRFESPTTYTVTRKGLMMLRETTDGELGMYPFGRDYTVKVDYLADHPTTPYGLPIVNIELNNAIAITSRDYYLDASISINGAGFLPDMETTTMQIKGRGNSSWSSVNPSWVQNPKNPYRIKFAEKQKPLGMKAGKNWCLIAQAQQGSMTSNPIGSRVAEMVGCAGANHFIPVELYINGEYRGSYCLTEKVGFSNNSIDLDDESNAAMLELDSYYKAIDKFKTARWMIPVNIHEPDFYEGTTNLTLQNVRDSFNRFINAVSYGEDIEPYVDLKHLARFLMVNELIVNQEIMHPKSTFCYNENVLSEDSRYIFGPVWDLDWAFGYETSRNYFTSDAERDFWTMSSMEIKGFWNKLRYCSEELNKQYYRVWTDFVNNHFDALIEYCDDYNKLIAKSVDHDHSKWSRGGSSSYNSITKNSKSWLTKRVNYVYNYISNTLGYADMDYLEPEPEETGIAVVTHHAEPKIQGIYDLQGRKMSSDFNQLPSGIYIVNGKKVKK